MHVTNRARVKPPTTATRRVAIVWRALRALSQTLEFPEQRVINTLGAKCVSRTTNGVRRIRNLFASATDVEGPVER